MKAPNDERDKLTLLRLFNEGQLEHVLDALLNATSQATLGSFILDSDLFISRVFAHMHLWGLAESSISRYIQKHPQNSTRVELRLLHIEAELLKNGQLSDGDERLLQSSKIYDLDVWDRRFALLLLAKTLDVKGNRQESLAVIEELKNTRDESDWVLVDAYSYFLKLNLGLLKNPSSSSVPKVIQAHEIFRLKWQILACLNRGSQTEAKQLWNVLAQKLPLDFSNDFVIRSNIEKSSTFGDMINGYVHREKTEIQTEVSKDKKLLARFLQILQQQPLALRREELIELIWQVPYEPALDSRFYRLVHRIRKELDLNLVCVNRTYRLVRPTHNPDKFAPK